MKKLVSLLLAAALMKAAATLRFHLWTALNRAATAAQTNLKHLRNRKVLLPMKSLPLKVRVIKKVVHLLLPPANRPRINLLLPASRTIPVIHQVLVSLRRAASRKVSLLPVSLRSRLFLNRRHPVALLPQIQSPVFQWTLPLSTMTWTEQLWHVTKVQTPLS